MEYPAHKRAVRRVFELLCLNPRFATVGMEVSMSFGKNGYHYIADIFGLMKDGHQICIEVDGKHHPARKNKERDRAFESHGIKTIRFDTSSIVGKKAVPDQTILDEIEYRLKPREKLVC